MKINKDVESYLTENFKHHYETLSEISSNNKGAFVQSDAFGYNLDKIVKEVFRRNRPKTCDAIVFNKNSMYFIEFKSGFSKFDFKQLDCPVSSCHYDKNNEICEKCKTAFKNYNNGKLDVELMSIANKMIDSLHFLEHYLCPKSEEGREIQLKYILAVDLSTNPREFIIETITSIAKNEKSTYPLNSIRDSVKRFGSETEGEKLYFEQVEVVSSTKFDAKYSFFNKMRTQGKKSVI